MNEQEIAEAIKIIREPIVVNSDIYHTFDQENYDKLQRVYDNCQWFINNQEQIMQNAIDNKKKADQLTNNWNELEEWLKNEIERFKEIAVNQGLFIDKELSIRLNARIKLIENILDKMKEIKEKNNGN